MRKFLYLFSFSFLTYFIFQFLSPNLSYSNCTPVPSTPTVTLSSATTVPVSCQQQPLLLLSTSTNHNTMTFNWAFNDFANFGTSNNFQVFCATGGQASPLSGQISPFAGGTAPGQYYNFTLPVLSNSTYSVIVTLSGTDYSCMGGLVDEVIPAFTTTATVCGNQIFSEYTPVLPPTVPAGGIFLKTDGPDSDGLSHPTFQWADTRNNLSTTTYTIDVATSPDFISWDRTDFSSTLPEGPGKTSDNSLVLSFANATNYVRISANGLVPFSAADTHGFQGSTPTFHLSPSASEISDYNSLNLIFSSKTLPATPRWLVNNGSFIVSTASIVACINANGNIDNGDLNGTFYDLNASTNSNFGSFVSTPVVATNLRGFNYDHYFNVSSPNDIPSSPNPVRTWQGTTGFISTITVTFGTGTITNSNPPLSPNTTYYFRSRAINLDPQNQYFTPYISATAVTLSAPPTVSSYTIAVTSFTAFISTSPNPVGTTIQVSTRSDFGDVAVTSAGVIGTQNPMSFTLTNLSTNTYYNIYARALNWQAIASTAPTISTYTWAVPVSSATTQRIFGGGYLVLSTGTNSSITQYAILVNLPLNPGTSQDGKYLPDPFSTGGSTISDLGGTTNLMSATPVWHLFNEWGGTNGVLLKNLAGFANYQFKVIARNGNGDPNASSTTTPPARPSGDPGVLTVFSSTSGIQTDPSGPVIQSTMNIPSGSWINTLFSSYTAKNSVLFHYSADQISNSNTANINDGSVLFSTNPFSFTASASGPWYVHCSGDAFGYQGQSFHSSLGGDIFNINIDTTPKGIAAVAAQYSATDTTSIANGVAIPTRHPYFTWTSTYSNTTGLSSLFAPATGYSTLFSTGSDPGDGAVPLVVNTTNTFASFIVTPTVAGFNYPYYFRVRLKDSAGNWGPSSLFTYVFSPTSTLTTATIQAIAAKKGGGTRTSTDGKYLSVDVSPTITVTFSNPMKPNSATSANNVTLVPVKDNLNGAQNSPVTLNLSLDSSKTTLTISPSTPLNPGWVYKLTILAAMLDLGENPLSSSPSVQFQTLFNGNSNAMIFAAPLEPRSKIEASAGALPGNVSVDIVAIKGGLAAPNGAPPRGPRYDSPFFVASSVLDSANQKIQNVLGSFAQTVTEREFIAYDESGNRITSNFNSPVTIRIPYDDVNKTGFVDGITPKVSVNNLRLYVLDETNNVWQRIPNTSIDTSTNSISAQVNHFSVYALISNPSTDVSQAYAYPVPFRPASGHTAITFANLPSEGSIRIYSTAGELVKTINFSNTSGATTLSWDVKNNDGDDLGSDVYSYIIQSVAGQKKGKLVVIR